MRVNKRMDSKLGKSIKAQCESSVNRNRSNGFFPSFCTMNIEKLPLPEPALTKLPIDEPF